MARMLFNKTAGLQKIGEGNFEVQINKKNNPLAEDIYDFPTYLETLQSSFNRIDFFEDGNKPVYNFLTVITPVEVSKSDPKEAGADYIPVFKHLKGGYFDHCLKQYNVSKIAYDLEKAEIRAANNESVYLPTDNPVFEALEKEGLNCYRPDQNGNTTSPKSVENLEESQPQPQPEQSEKSSSNPFKKSSFQFRRSSV